MKGKLCLLKSMNEHCQLHIRIDTRTMDLNNGLFRPPTAIVSSKIPFTPRIPHLQALVCLIIA